MHFKHIWLILDVLQAILQRLALAWRVLQTLCALSQSMAQLSAPAQLRLVRKPAVLSVVAMERLTRIPVTWKSNLAKETKLSLPNTMADAKVDKELLIVMHPCCIAC